MSTARDLLRDLAMIGAMIQPEGDRLILRAGATPVPAGLVSRVRRAKAELLATLATDDVKKEPTTLVEPNLVAPPDWFERVASPAEGEPRFDEPCAERRGRIEELPGRLFLHFCIECGRWGAFGYGVNLRAGRLGGWYCATHRPRRLGRPPDAAITMGPS
jgi:hypothetical protein